MSVATVKDRLAQILENETSAVKAYASSPHEILPANMPMFVVTTQAGSVMTGGNGSAYDVPVESRNYNLILLALPWSIGSEYQAEEKCEGFFTEVRTAFTRRESLDYPRRVSPLDNVLQAKLISDTGIANVVYGDNSFSGVIWTIQVTEIFEPGKYEA